VVPSYWDRFECIDETEELELDEMLEQGIKPITA
jgi:hypothetical protein